MKTRHLLAAFASVALASCVTESEYEPNLKNEQTKITFGSPVMHENSVGSRAKYHDEIGEVIYGTTKRTYPHEEDFIIFARKYSGPFQGWIGTTEIEDALFNGEVVSYIESLDGWAPTKTDGDDPFYYWPEGMKLVYSAVSPADMEQGSNWNGISYSSDGLTITDFKVPSSAGNHFDLLFAKRKYNVTKESMYSTADKYSGAPIEFQHALSSIHFSLQNESSSTIILQKISLYGVYEKGTFKENIDENKGFDYVKTTGTNKEVNVIPGWTVDKSNTIDLENAYVAFTAEGVNKDGVPYEGLEFPENPQYISNMMALDNHKNAGVNEVLLVMPQDLPPTAELRIDYKVINGSNTTTAHKVVSILNAPKYNETTKEIDEGVTIDEWQLGTKYTYRLVYSSAAAKKDKIYFAPSTEGWVDAGIYVIDLAGATSVTP